MSTVPRQRPPSGPTNCGWRRAQALPESRVNQKAVKDARARGSKVVTFTIDDLDSFGGPPVITIDDLQQQHQGTVQHHQAVEQQHQTLAQQYQDAGQYQPAHAEDAKEFQHKSIPDSPFRSLLGPEEPLPTVHEKHVEAAQEQAVAKSPKSPPSPLLEEVSDQKNRSLLRGPQSPEHPIRTPGIQWQFGSERPQSAQHARTIQGLVAHQRPQTAARSWRPQTAVSSRHTYLPSDFASDIEALHQSKSTDSEIVAFARPRSIKRAQSASSLRSHKIDKRVNQNFDKEMERALLVHISGRSKTDDQVDGSFGSCGVKGLKQNRLLRAISSMPVRYQNTVPLDWVEEMHDSISKDVSKAVKEKQAPEQDVIYADSLQDWLTQPGAALPRQPSPRQSSRVDHLDAGPQTSVMERYGHSPALPRPQSRTHSLVEGHVDVPGIYESIVYERDADDLSPSNDVSRRDSTQREREKLRQTMTLQFAPLPVDHSENAELAVSRPSSTSQKDSGGRLSATSPKVSGTGEAPFRNAHDSSMNLEVPEAPEALQRQGSACVAASAKNQASEEMQVQVGAASGVQKDTPGQCLATSDALVDRQKTACHNPAEDASLQVSRQPAEQGEAQAGLPNERLSISEVQASQMNPTTLVQNSREDGSPQCDKAVSQFVEPPSSASEDQKPAETLTVDQVFDHEDSIEKPDDMPVEEHHRSRQASSCSSEYVYDPDNNEQAKKQPATGETGGTTDGCMLSMRVRVPSVVHLPDSSPTSPQSGGQSPCGACVCGRSPAAAASMARAKVTTTGAQHGGTAEPAPEPMPEVGAAPGSARRAHRKFSGPPPGWTVLSKSSQLDRPQMYDSRPDTHQHVSLLRPQSSTARRKRWAAPPRLPALDMAELLAAAQLLNQSQLTPRMGFESDEPGIVLASEKM